MSNKTRLKIGKLIPATDKTTQCVDLINEAYIPVLDFLHDIHHGLPASFLGVEFKPKWVKYFRITIDEFGIVRVMPPFFGSIHREVTGTFIVE